MELLLTAQVVVMILMVAVVVVVVSLVNLRLAVDQLIHLLLGVIKQRFFFLITAHLLLELQNLVLFLSELVLVVCWHIQPWVLQHLLSSSSSVVVPLEHGQQEVRKRLRLLFSNSILFSQHLLQRPVAQSTDAAQVALRVKELARVFA